MKLTIVGATGSMSGPDGAASCYLIQATGFDPDLQEDRVWSLVLDIGPGAFGQLWRYMDPRNVDAILVSHGHPDHLADIMSLEVFLKWHPEGTAPRKRVIGPEDIPHRIAQIEGYRDDAGVSTFYHFDTAKEGRKFQVGPFLIYTFPGYHTVESYGFRVEGPSDVHPGETVSIAYTGDTDLCAPMFQMAHGVDLLLSECGFTNETQVRGIHLSGTRAGLLARESGVKQMVLTHIQPWTDPEIPQAEAAEILGYVPEVAVPGATWEV